MYYMYVQFGVCLTRFNDLQFELLEDITHFYIYNIPI